MRRLITTSLVLFVFLIPQLAEAAFPRPTGFVNDFANVIQAGTKTKLEGLLQAVERKSGYEIAVVTIPSLDERPIEDYAEDLYKTWGIGKKGKDEGALILVAPNQKQVRIEVGYGLEGAINDARAGRIIRDAMIPFFKQGDITKGIVAGTQAVVGIALNEKGLSFKDLGSSGAAVASSAPKKKGGPLSVLGKILLFLIMAYLFIRHPWLFLFFLASAGRGGGGVRGGGGFSGGFGGFGGGLSGGGGASGRW
jgi:uncharacterized protein